MRLSCTLLPNPFMSPSNPDCSVYFWSHAFLHRLQAPPFSSKPLSKLTCCSAFHGHFQLWCCLVPLHHIYQTQQYQKDTMNTWKLLVSILNNVFFQEQLFSLCALFYWTCFFVFSYTSREDACLRRKTAPEVHTPALSCSPAWAAKVPEENWCLLSALCPTNLGFEPVFCVCV